MNKNPERILLTELARNGEVESHKLYKSIPHLVRNWPYKSEYAIRKSLKDKEKCSFHIEDILSHTSIYKVYIIQKIKFEL